MSGYNYYERNNSGCSSCTTRSDYETLEETKGHDCAPSCICRHNKERSVRDTMDINYYINNKPFGSNIKPLPPPGNNGWKSHMYGDDGL